MNKVFVYLDRISKALRCPLRLTFCGQKVSKKPSATSPPQQKPLGCPAMLSFAGSQRTRWAQTALALDPANLALLGGSQAHQVQQQDQNRFSGRNLSQTRQAVPVRAGRKCCLVFEPLKLIRRKPNLRKASTKVLSEFHFDPVEVTEVQRFTSAIFWLLFCRKTQKSHSHQLGEAKRRNAYDLQFREQKMNWIAIEKLVFPKELNLSGVRL